jgi:glycosyltransferase involved in cell wall biosynthesis
MINKIVFIDSCFHSFDGHQYNYIKNLTAVARSRGIETFSLANKSINPRIQEEVSAIPAFDFLGIEIISDFESDTAKNFNYNFFHFNNIYFMNLVNATHRLPPLDERTAVFFTTTNFRHILGILSWLDLFPERSRPRPVIVLRDRDLMPERNAPLYRQVLPILASPRFDARFCSEAPRIAAHYSQLAGTTVDVIPVPIDAPRYGGAPAPIHGRPVTIAFLGQARLSKGFHLLDGVTKRIWAKAPETRLTIQAQIGEFSPDHDAPIAAALQRLRALSGPRLKLLDGAVDYDAYLAELFATDIVLLPYDPQIYRESASAVLIEGLAAGKAVVVPAGTWMADDMKRVGAGFVAFDGHGPEPIAVATLEAISRLDVLHAASARARDAWIHEHDVARIIDYLCADRGASL